ncbi:MAG: 50S ribosomal protein L3 [Thermoleophilia bacterium]
MPAILGIKLGMSQIFTEEGDRIPVTVIEAGPCAVTQVKTDDTDGYQAVQIGFGEVKERKLTKAEMGHLKKAGVGPLKHLVEVRGEADAQPGDAITVEAFEVGQKVKVSGVSKGKGFAGVIKRHNFAGGPASHGSHFHRAPGSVGASAWPSRVFKGLKLPGQMGNKKSTQLGLTVVGTDLEKNLLFVKGAVPGSKKSIVFIQGY